MPVKLRRSKRRIDPRAELEAWSGLFDCGYDYFDELDGWGDWPSTDSADQTKRDAAREAWQRLGGEYMAKVRERRLTAPRPAGWPEKEPWAFIEFGEPPHAR